MREEIEDLVTRGPKLLRVPEVADTLSVSVRTVETLISEQRLRPVRIRNCRRIPAEQVEALIQEAGRGRGGAR